MGYRAQGGKMSPVNGSHNGNGSREHLSWDILEKTEYSTYVTAVGQVPYPHEHLVIAVGNWTIRKG